MAPTTDGQNMRYHVTISDSENKKIRGRFFNSAVFAKQWAVDVFASNAQVANAALWEDGIQIATRQRDTDWR